MESGIVCHLIILGRFIGRKIEKENSIRARLCGVVVVGFETVSVDRIEIGKEDDGGLVGLAKAPDEVVAGATTLFMLTSG